MAKKSLAKLKAELVSAEKEEQKIDKLYDKAIVKTDRLRNLIYEYERALDQ